MNILLTLGFLVLAAYLAGRLFEKAGLPKIIGYILTGVAFSPNSIDLIESQVSDQTETLLSVCLGFIAFEVGGELNWERLKQHGKEILNITWMESLFPVILIFLVIRGISVAFPDALGFIGNGPVIITFAILLASLAGPTDPTATLAVIHQYKAKGKVKDTILGVAALDDGMGVVIFSVAIAVASISIGEMDQPAGSLLVDSLKHLGGGLLTGMAFAFFMSLVFHLLEIKGEGQWIVFIFSMIALCFGTAARFGFDELLACMTMGATIANTSRQQKTVFGILERYTEELIFLFFFVLSGLRLNVHSIPEALPLILLFIIFRTIGKFGGSYLGASLAGADPAIKKYTMGGLIPQGGIVIGLALVLGRYEAFHEIAPLILTVIMGTTVIHELIGPLAAKYALKKAGEIEGEGN